MSKPQWKPVVYTRTYEVDFRFIALPNNFDLETKNWLESYISPSMRSVQTKNLSNHPRWVLVKNEQYCLVGVTCLIRDLISSSEENQEYTQDTFGRPVYGFFGYICEMDNIFKNDDFYIPSKIMSNFECLFNYVKENWFLKSYQIYQRQSEQSEFTVENINQQFDELVCENNSEHKVFEEINFQNKNAVKLWSIEKNDQLWRSACKINQNISLCLNLANQLDLINSPFLNGTVLDLQEDEEIIRNNQKKQITQENWCEIENDLEQQNNDWNEEFNKNNLRGNEQKFVQTPRNKTRNDDLDSPQYTENDTYDNCYEKNGIFNIIGSTIVNYNNILSGFVTDKETTTYLKKEISKVNKKLDEIIKLYNKKENNLTREQKGICKEKLGESKKIIISVGRDVTNVRWKIQHLNQEEGIKILLQRMEKAINYISEVNSILTNKNTRLGLKQKEQSQDTEQSIWDW
ncbi:hypothetical protein [Cyanobacterium aponinum]|uniref:Uncharacterized protein n=1 Tax=Cyanobacterium aponinum 0216 TaxID=2676140 RepID=A0A844GZB3_9CHRO|nr:hypothetical protein [Cyanobacterium aponinum]MTF40331.1 hypothetical protein [Cyanobacterium aponinum 0216]